LRKDYTCHFLTIQIHHFRPDYKQISSKCDPELYQLKKAATFAYTVGRREQVVLALPQQLHHNMAD